ncbi:MAG: type III pantothenate kinase [Muribaculaceae bacterium]|nr:type III pantothenate kinase [Muribaculaceae bacterium]
MNTLTLDIGNHRVKADIWDDEGHLFRRVMDEVSVDEIMSVCQRLEVAGIIYSSVRKGDKDLMEELKKAFPKTPVVNFDHEEITNFYEGVFHYSGNLGPDRAAAFLGAEDLSKGCNKLIIDAGTAITFDLVDCDRNFRGGNISLGYYGRLEALAHSTSLLPEVKKFDTDEKFGRDTVSAILSGAKNGVVGEVIYNVSLASDIMDLYMVVVTGADAPIFLEELKMHARECIYDEYLVGRGLNYHLRFRLDGEF